MNEYERSPLGDIIIVKNIVFTTDRNLNTRVDHAWRRGRPCIIIFSDDEYDYYLPLTTSIEKKRYYKKIENRYLKLQEDDFIFLNNGKNVGLINTEEVQRKKISGYNPIGKISKEAYKRLIDKFKEFHKEEITETIKKRW